MSTEIKTKHRVVVVTGGNRGIGLEIVNGLSKIEKDIIIFTSRTEEGGMKALEHFRTLGRTNVEYRPLDLCDEKSIDSFIKGVLRDFNHVDCLVNNAGTYDEGPSESPVLASNTNIADAEKEIKVNALGPLRLITAFLPKMKERNYGRIVNMSSSLGSLKGNYPHSLGYRMSKAALNMVTRTFAAEFEDKNILVNSLSPGYVKTDMTGGENSKATRTPEEGADTAIWLATLDDKGPRGGFFQDKKPIEW